MQLLVLAAAIINAQRPVAPNNQYWDDVVALPQVENGVLFDTRQPVTAVKSVTLGTGRFGGQCMVVDTGQAYRYGNTPFVLAGDFTIEGHIQCTSAVRKNNYIFDAGANGMVFKLIDDRWKLSNAGGPAMIDTNVKTTLNQWYHFAIVRQGALVKMFIDGVMIGQVVFTAVMNATTFTWGNYGGGGAYSHEGKLDACRISLLARYTGNFTPPMSPFPVGGPEAVFDPFWDKTLLAVKGGPAGTAIDLAGKATIAAVGSASLSGLQKRFGNESMKTNGTGSFFRCNATNGTYDFTGDFTVEAWVFPTTNLGIGHVIGRASSGNAGGYRLVLEQLKPRIYYSTSSGAWTATSPANGSEVPLNQWTHLALSRIGGVLGLFVNGVRTATQPAGALNVSSLPITIGAANDGTEPFAGYIDSVRITAAGRYSGNFSPRLTTDFATRMPASNGEFVAGYDAYFSNNVFAAQFDNTLVDRRQTVGPTGVGTSVTFDSTRKLFDKSTLTMTTGTLGSVSYVVSKSVIVGQEFTVEAWINTNYNDVNTALGLISQWGSLGWGLVARSGTLRFYYNNVTSFIQSTTNIAGQTWVHVAVSRHNGVITLYINGVAEASVTYTGVFNHAATLQIGKLDTAFAANGYRLNMADLRITNGFSRYNTNFIPPSKPHPVSSLAA